MRFRLLVVAVSSLVVLGAQGSDDLVEIARLPSYSEGPVFDHDGNLFVSHPPYISRISPGADPVVWAETGTPNGHKILADGTHLVCDRNVLRLSASGETLGNAATDCGGHALRQTNDITLDPNGGFYFTDPGEMPAAAEQPIGRVCYVDAEGYSYLVAEGLGFPNGIVLRPDGSTLLVAESTRNRVLQFEVSSPGKASAPRVFADLPGKEGASYAEPDGMALDVAGNLYVAHYGKSAVQVLAPDGELLRTLPGGNVATSNVAFGGAEMDDLYMTGGELDYGAESLVYRLHLDGTGGLLILP